MASIELPTWYTAIVKPIRFIPGQMPLFDNYYSVFATVVGYLATIYFLQQWMKDRKPYSLKTFVLLHNVFLCALSAAMMTGIVFELLLVLRNTRFADIDNVFLCDQLGTLSEGRLIWWFYLFHLSKVYEFIDTVILVLKKKEIIFLHIYHHCITFVLTYVMMSNEVAVQWISSLANVMVHTPMYYYYAISTLGYTVWWKKYITTMQIIQFVVDTVANFTAYAYRLYSEVNYGTTCSGPWGPWLFGQVVLVSFLVLFILFYRKTYNAKPAAKEGEKENPKQKKKN
jgi:hypothetical protein